MIHIKAAQFGGFSLEGLVEALKQGKQITTDFPVTLNPVTDGVMVTFVVWTSPVQALRTNIGPFKLTTEGLSRAVYEFLNVLERQNLVDGFQVEAFDGETDEQCLFCHEAFEVLDLATALSLYMDAIEFNPHDRWLIHVVKRGEVEAPAYRKWEEDKASLDLEQLHAECN